VRECEALFIDSIASAKRSIWVENQYFTNLVVAKALAARLREPDGPEIVIVGPKSCSGWLEEQTMGALRQQVLLELTRADLHGRLRLSYAVTSRVHDVCTFIHSKIMVIDDEMLRIGSANLSSRSMGMDTECDLTVVAHGDARVREKITHVRNRLMAEHLGTDAEGVARAIERAGSLRGAVDSFAGNDRALEPIEVCEDEEPKEMSEVVKLAADPDEPMVVTRAIDRLLPEIDTSNEYRRVAVLALPLALLGAAYIALVRAGEISDWFSGAGPRAFLEAAPGMPDLMVWALALSVVGGLMLVPLEVLVLGAIVLFGPLVGGPLAFVAALIASAIGYFAGKALGGKRVIPLIGVRAYRVGRELPGRSSVSVAVLRLVSAFSSASIHLLCGATRVPLRSYALGTIAALVPIIVVLSLLGGLLRRTILHPGPWTAAATIATAFLLAAIALRVRRRLLVKRFHAARLDQEQRAVYG
jgi:uncharacterized membrane protein YdjX (TVP38/TMEM64 family)